MPDTTETKRNYKKTLNLPATSFPMRANLGQNEPATQKRWEQGGLYARILEDRRDAEPFVFHDGPPYANGSIHAGHLLNKVLRISSCGSASWKGGRAGSCRAGTATASRSSTR